VPLGDGRYRAVPEHPSKHGANTEPLWSRPLQERRHRIWLSGPAVVRGVAHWSARVMVTVRNSQGVEPAATAVPVLTVHGLAILLGRSLR